MDEKQLEEQISSERSRLSSDRMDISFGELLNMYNSDELIIKPEYQRLFRWSSFQKTALIESILLGIPIPPIFVAEDEDGIWELVDGLQRISTIISFFGNLKENLSIMSYYVQNDNEDDNEDKIEENIGNKWTLEAGGLVSELKGFNIDTLPRKYAINIKRAVCRVEILRGESNTAMKYELFKRLNSGGSKLTPQEIRNAIYRGINPKINNLIEDLCENIDFQNLTSLSDQKKHELYDQELVLRFIAFYKNIDNINGNTEKFLNYFMENAVNDETFDSKKYVLIFNEIIKLIKLLDDDTVFKTSQNSFSPSIFEGILIGIAHNIEIYRDNIELLAKKISILKNDENFKKFCGSASNSKSRIRNRLARANSIFSATE